MRDGFGHDIVDMLAEFQEAGDGGQGCSLPCNWFTSLGVVIICFCWLQLSSDLLAFALSGVWLCGAVQGTA